MGYITYQELFVRLLVLPHESEAIVDGQEQNPGMTTVKEESGLLVWTQLEEYMKNAKPWRDPNVTLTDLADGVKSNRTTISILIQKAGYDNFYDYIARYRVMAFCQAVREGRVNNVQDAFFEVGFRNRNTALNQFKKQMGVTPSDYLQKVGR